VSESLWQTPQACILMRTSPATGLGISRSTISKSAPGLGTCAAFIGAIPTFVVAMNVSYEFFTTSYSCPAASKMISTSTGAPERKACDTI
jgi:hypothetical protein